VPSSLRFSNVSPRDVAEVKRLRDIHRGVTPAPPHQGEVPPGPEEQAVLALVKKAQPVYGLVRRLWEPLERSYVRAHVRTLPNGRQVHVPAYFTKVVPKGEHDTPRKPPALKQEPPHGVHTPQTPEQLAHRLVRHVKEGTLTQEEALANIVHLEDRAARGHGLEHGHGPAWKAEHLKEFANHARDKLLAHVVEQKRQQQAKAEQEKQRQEQEKQERERKEKRNQQRRERRKQTKPDPYAHIQDTETRLPVEQEHNAQHFTKAPPYIQAALRKASALKSVNGEELGKGSGYEHGNAYFAGAKGIVFHPAPFQGEPGDYAGPMWRHEYGHHVDHDIVNSPYNFASWEAHPVMERDRKKLVAFKDVQAKTGRQEKTQETFHARYDALYDGFPSDATAEERRTHALAYFQREFAKVGLSQEDLTALDPEFTTRSTLNQMRILTAWEAGDADTFIKRFPNHTEHGVVQDYLGAVTRNALVMVWSHSDAYYGSTEHYTVRHTAEAYANWFSCHGHGHPVWRKVLAHFTPHTNKAFQEITERWLKAPPTTTATS
jgi:hypothetical protein